SLYTKFSRSELASKLFALSVDLEAVLERKREHFESEMNSLVEEIRHKSKEIKFDAWKVSIPVDEEERVRGFYAFLVGLFGYERRVRRRRYVTSARMNTRDIADGIEKYIAEARA